MLGYQGEASDTAGSDASSPRSVDGRRGISGAAALAGNVGGGVGHDAGDGVAYIGVGRPARARHRGQLRIIR
jgi:hypothetical protein